MPRYFPIPIYDGAERRPDYVRYDAIIAVSSPQKLVPLAADGGALFYPTPPELRVLAVFVDGARAAAGDYGHGPGRVEFNAPPAGPVSALVEVIE